MRAPVLIWGLAALLVLGMKNMADDKDKTTPNRDAKDAGLKLEGEYAIISGERFGKPEAPERIGGNLVRITADKISVTDKEKKETYVCTYVVDTAKKPYLITMTETMPEKGTVAKGLVEMDDDTVRLIYALPGGDLPTEFRTKDKQLLFVMKKVKLK